MNVDALHPGYILQDAVFPSHRSDAADRSRAELFRGPGAGPVVTEKAGVSTGLTAELESELAETRQARQEMISAFFAWFLIQGPWATGKRVKSVIDLIRCYKAMSRFDPFMTPSLN